MAERRTAALPPGSSASGAARRHRCGSARRHPQPKGSRRTPGRTPRHLARGDRGRVRTGGPGARHLARGATSCGGARQRRCGQHGDTRSRRGSRRTPGRAPRHLAHGDRGRGRTGGPGARHQAPGATSSGVAHRRRCGQHGDTRSRRVHGARRAERPGTLRTATVAAAAPAVPAHGTRHPAPPPAESHTGAATGQHGDTRSQRGRGAVAQRGAHGRQHGVPRRLRPRRRKNAARAAPGSSPVAISSKSTRWRRQPARMSRKCSSQ